MMDELELLKKDWQKKEKDLPKLSYEDIYKMIWKKSSSFVKWIFYISIAEFVFWFALNRIPQSSDDVFDQSKYLNQIDLGLEIVSYAIMIYFIIKFYINFKKINAADSSKKLMENILKVHKTVKTYVWFSIGLFIVALLLFFIDMVIIEPELSELATKAEGANQPWLIYLMSALVFLALIGVTCGILWLFYRLLYGILLKRLKQNYKELKKLEV